MKNHEVCLLQFFAIFGGKMMIYDDEAVQPGRTVELDHMSCQQQLM
jgi:hypothetical protein